MYKETFKDAALSPKVNETIDCPAEGAVSPKAGY